MNIFDKAVEQAEEAIDEAKTGALDDIGDAKDAALQEIEQSTGNFADAFSTSTTYAAGDYVIYSGQLYRFTANHAAGAWSGSDAEAVTVGEELTDLNAETTSLKEDYSDILNSAYVTDTASGAIASFPDGADGVPVKSLTVNIEPVQSGSGDPSPDNVRPISGHTSAVVTRTGKNLFDASMLLDGTGWTESNGVYSGSTADLTNKYPNALPVSVLPYDGQLTLSCDYYNSSSSRWGYVYFYYTDGTENYHQLNASSWTHLTATSAQGKTVERIRIGNSNTQTGYLRNIQLEFGASATAYESYNGQTVTIDLDGTCYGGTLDVLTGVLTVDRAMVDLGSLTWNYDSGLSRYESSVISDMKPSAARSGYILSDRYQSITDGRPSGNVPNNSIYTVIEKKIFVVDNAYSSASSFKAAVTGSLAIYPLATPQTVQLTANEVTTLLGQNNIWSDAGDVEVEYRADTKLYIEKLTAPTEDDMIADHAISANSFFMVGNNLYRATTAIASGATITVGTNATKLSLSDALNALS